MLLDYHTHVVLPKHIHHFSFCLSEKMRWLSCFVARVYPAASVSLKFDSTNQCQNKSISSTNTPSHWQCPGQREGEREDEGSAHMYVSLASHASTLVRPPPDTKNVPQRDTWSFEGNEPPLLLCIQTSSLENIDMNSARQGLIGAALQNCST
jgi:hypothetical protein